MLVDSFVSFQPLKISSFENNRGAAWESKNENLAVLSNELIKV